MRLPCGLEAACNPGAIHACRREDELATAASPTPSSSHAAVFRPLSTGIQVTAFVSGIIRYVRRVLFSVWNACGTAVP